MKPSEDQLAIFENELRNNGKWCDHTIHDQFAHFMVCKHPKSRIAISLCGNMIVALEKLHEDHVKQKCLACALYYDARKETKDKLFATLLALTNERENQIQTIKE